VSVHAALSMVCAGARGATADEMAATLHLPASGTVPGEAYRALLAALHSPTAAEDMPHRAPTDQPGGGPPAYELTAAQGLWAQKGCCQRLAYGQFLERYFRSEPNELDFRRSPEGACRQINAWAGERTAGRIRELIAPGQITTACRLVLTSAIYFRSAWESQFDEERTRDRPFRLADGRTVRAAMMRQTGRFRYGETDALQVLSLSYGGDDLDMLVVLPKRVGGLGDAEAALAGHRRFDDLLARTEVDVALPRFGLVGQFELAEPLRRMGMTRVFMYPEADLTGIGPTGELFLAELIHRSVVTVDEDGTEAAGASAALMMAGAAPGRRERPKRFRADHPFLLLIRHRETRAVLFIGRVADPTVE
jgi:serpin B